MLETDLEELSDKEKHQLYSIKDASIKDDNVATKFFSMWDAFKKRRSGPTVPKPTGFDNVAESVAKSYNLDLVSENLGGDAAGSGGAAGGAMDANMAQPDDTGMAVQGDAGMENTTEPAPPSFDKPMRYVAELGWAALETVDKELEETARDKIYNLKGDSIKNDQQATAISTLESLEFGSICVCISTSL